MATYTTFYYDDENQGLAGSLFPFKQKNKTYAVERIGVDGINQKDDTLAEFFVQAEVDAKFRKNKTDKWQTLEEFWTLDRMFAKSCPHWQRRSVKVTVGVGLRYNTDDNPIKHKMVTLSTWFDNKYKSQAEGLASAMVSDDYDATAQQVEAEWNDDCITDNMVQEIALLNGIGTVHLLSKHLERERASHTKKVLDIFAKVKI
jgi:hypothetical protein